MRLLHLSDVHFGATDARLVQPVIDLAHDLQPDAVVISGDLTQRARPGQFAAARAFIDRLPGPVLCVPGNHDVPLWNLGLRLLAPFWRYRRVIGDDLEPCLTLPDGVIQGLNTANPLVWKSGRLRRGSTERLTATCGAAAKGAMRIAVLHHAPVPASDGTPADMADATAALAALSRSGVDIVLSGHTHRPHAGFADTTAGILFLQAGTALSTRLKTDTNDFSLLKIGPGSVTQQSWLARRGEAFVAASPTHFLKTATGWQRVIDTV